MFRESNSNGAVSKGQVDDGVLRHSDGSINFNAYRAAARRERTAAIVSSIESAASFARAISSWTGAVLTGKSGSPAARHQAHHAR
jgi:hypothetical protein